MILLKRVIEGRYLYLLGLAGMGVGLPLGRALISISVFVLLGAWLIDGLWNRDLKRKWQSLIQDKWALALMGIFLLHLLGLIIPDQDYNYAFKDLRTKLPLLLLPVVFVGMELKQKERESILLIFVASVLISTLIAFYRFEVGLSKAALRESILYCSHIRLSLMMVLSCFILFRAGRQKGHVITLISTLIAVWFVFFMAKAQLMSGLVILIVTMSIVLFNAGLQRKQRSLLIIGTLIPLVTIIFLGVKVSDHFSAGPLDETTLATHTALGNPYDRPILSDQMEHGRHIWANVSTAELRESWNTRSIFKLDGTDAALEARLIRYLNSKGEQKDASGVSSLTDREIADIVGGSTCPKELEKSGIDGRISALLYEIDGYMNGQDPSSNSLTQRFEFWRAGYGIIKSKPLLGVGTGGVPKAFEVEYQQNETQLQPQYRLRAHNQYLTMAIAFGILGFSAFLFLLYAPVIRDGRWRLPGALPFLVILSMSFLNEDTLETQQGLTFMVYFAGLFILSANTSR